MRESDEQIGVMEEEMKRCKIRKSEMVGWMDDRNEAGHVDVQRLGWVDE